ncbi:MAG: hypothetical protein LBK57_11405 [Clostridiales Family XIII bacterium]|jgi:hypothetical protein|nr:hypothetical protein [Clostridiales Family XIII bacterium]
MSSTAIIHEKKIISGQYMEVDIFPIKTSSITAARKKGRAKATHLTSPKQREINSRRAKRYLTNIARKNFDPGDYFLTLTFSDKNLPATFEAAEQESNKFLRRLRNAEKKHGLNLKYIRVLEGEPSGTTGAVRLHIHLLLSAGLSKTEMEDLWRRPKRKGKKVGEMIGYVDVQQIGYKYTSPESLSDDDPAALYIYLSKSFGEIFDELDEVFAEPAKGTHIRKRWSASHNIERPEETVDDGKYEPADFYDIIYAKKYSTPKFLNDNYPGWAVLKADDIQVYEDEDTGYKSLHLRLHRRR